MVKVKKEHFKEGAKFFGGIASGFSLFWLTSHPTKSPVREKLPRKKIKNVSLSPEIRVHHKDKSYHLHHWTLFSILYIPIIIFRKKLPKSKLFHGFWLGSIIQGLTYKDRFNLIDKTSDTASPKPQ